MSLLISCVLYATLSPIERTYTYIGNGYVFAVRDAKGEAYEIDDIEADELIMNGESGELLRCVEKNL